MSLPIDSNPSSSINSLDQLNHHHSSSSSSSSSSFELSNLVLVTTLDGKLHGLDRNTGKWNWTLNDPTQKTEGLIDLTSVQSNHHQSNSQDHQSEIYAIEPHNDGDLYVLSRTSTSSKLEKLPLSVSQLVNLSPFTFPSDDSKMFVGKKDTNLIGIDLKNGEVVGVLKADNPNHRKPRKGKGRQTCERVDSLLNPQTCRMEDDAQGSSSRFHNDDHQNEDDIDQRPRDLLYIGRTDYQISIYSKPDTLIQTLRYSTYSPSNLGHSLQSQWTRTPDESYLEPMHDGNLICFQFDRLSNRNPTDPLQHQDGKIKWQNSFHFPVTNIFDVAFPKKTQDLSKDLSPRHDPSRPSWEHTHSSQDKSPSTQQPVMFVQPRLMPSQGGLSSQTFSSMYEQYNPTKSSQSEYPHSSTSRPESDPTAPPKKAFLGNFDESFYIMSQDNYPLVSFAPSAQQALGNNNVIGTHTLLDARLATHTIGTIHDRSLLLEAGSSAMNDLRYDRGRWRDVPPLALDPVPQPPLLPSPEPRPSLSKKFSLSSILSPTPSNSPLSSKPPKPVIQQRAAKISSLIVRSFKNQLSQSNSSHDPNEQPDDITLSMNPTLAILFFTFVLVWLASKKTRSPHSYRWDNLARRTSSSLPDSIARNKPANLFEYWLGGRQSEDVAHSLVVSQKTFQNQESNSDSLTDDLVERSVALNAGTSDGVCEVDSKVDIINSEIKSSGLAVPSASDQADETTDEIDNDDGEQAENGTLETPKPKPKPKRRRGKRPGQKAAAAAAAAAKAEAEACKAQVDFPVSIIDTTRSLQSHPSMTTIATAGPSQPTLRFAEVENEHSTPSKPKLNLRKRKSHLNSASSLKEPSLSDPSQHTTPTKIPDHKPPELDISATPTSFSSLLSPVDSGGFQPHKIGSLMITDETLGYGSHGTVVLKGTFQGRQVAIKRLLKDFVTLATHEVSLLQESDDHPNVIRYFVKESLDNFLYIALELCNGSLFDLIERKNFHPEYEEILENFNPKKALKQITSGLRYLHSLKIVHRDIKPQNILISFTKGPALSSSSKSSKNHKSINKPAKPSNQRRQVRMLISDFGLCKKLDIDESSFAQTANHGAGSFGYRAPEILKGQVNLNEQSNLTPNSSITSSTINSTSNGSNEPNGNGSNGNRLTRSIDIFSLGCIFYYVLTRGEHPFGSRYEREVNILKGEIGLEQLDGFDEEAFEAQYLIRSMLRSNPKERPTAEQVLQNPYFWNPTKRLMFLCESSDRFEILDRENNVCSEETDQTHEILSRLENIQLFYQHLVSGGRRFGGGGELMKLDWDKRVDRVLLENLGKYRRYDYGSVRDLLRVLRNKKHHFQDLPENLKRTLGNLPDGFLNYFTKRFPSLIIHVYLIIDQFFVNERMFYQYFFRSDEDLIDDL